ncbi:MAG: hypothetical protein ACLR6J_13355 [Parabacteroides merdae]
MGTSTANYNSLFSNSRKGYDAEIDLLTGLRGQIESSRIYKPEADVPISDIQLHWDADRLLFSPRSTRTGSGRYTEMNIDGSNLHQRSPLMSRIWNSAMPITCRTGKWWRRPTSVTTAFLACMATMW